MDFLKSMFKFRRKLSHLPSGRVLKCLSWPDVIPQLSQQMSQEGGGGLFLLRSRSLLGTAEGLVLPTSRRLSHRWNWWGGARLSPRQECCCVLHKKSPAAVIQRVLQVKYLGTISGLTGLRTATGPNADLLWVAQLQWHTWTKTTSTHKLNGLVHWDGEETQQGLRLGFTNLLGLGLPMPRSAPGHCDKYLV